MKTTSCFILAAGLSIFSAVSSACAADITAGKNIGREYVGEQLRAFSAEPDGVIVSTRDAQIDLYHTEGVSFRLSGKVWLGGRSATLDFPKDLPDGFALFIREWDSLHRYSLTSRSLIAKRRLIEGVKEKKIAQVADFGVPANGQWISFIVEATPSRISYRFGDSSAEAKGPLDMDGLNKIVLAKGSKLKDVQLEILEPKSAADQTASVTTAPTKSIPLQARMDGSGTLALSFQTVPAKTYRLQFKNDLTDPVWTPLGTPVTATTSNIVMHDSTSQPKRFYSVVPEQ